MRLTRDQRSERIMDHIVRKPEFVADVAAAPSDADPLAPGAVVVLVSVGLRELARGQVVGSDGWKVWIKTGPKMRLPVPRRVFCNPDKTSWWPEPELRVERVRRELEAEQEATSA